MKNLLKRSIALFLSVCIAFESIGCAGGLYMEYDMLFDRNLLFDSGSKTNTYNAWFYNEDLYNDGSIRMQNVKSWQDYLEFVYTVTDLEKFIYRSPSITFDKNKEFKKLREKRVDEKNIAQKETKFVDFIEFALRVETLIDENAVDPWAEEEKKLDLNGFQMLIEEASEKIKEINDSFIKERYAYQLVKLYRYSGQYKGVENTYNTYFSKGTSMLSFWAMEHYAGILQLMGLPYQANYYFVKVYANCPSKRSSSFLSMQLSTEDDFQKTLALCGTDSEKMALYYIRSMQTKTLALEDMKVLVKTLGNHEYVRIVMTHEINKLEQNYLNRLENSSENEEELLVRNQLKDYIKELIKFNEGLLAKEGDDYFWHLSLAYLYYLDHQHSKCSSLLELIKPKTVNIQKQYDIIYIINYLETKKTLTEVDENIIGNKLFSLNSEQSSYPILNDSEDLGDYTNESFYYDEYNTINEFIFSKIYERYKTKNAFLELIFSGNTIDGDLYFESPYRDEDGEEKIIDSDYIDQLLQALDKTPETKLALFAADWYFNIYNDYGYRANKLTDFDFCEATLKEFKATLLMRDPARLGEAVSLLKQLPSNFSLEPISGDPFEFNIENPNFEEHFENRYSLSRKSKLQLAEELFALEKTKSSGSDYYQLGLAYYNTSYYGLQWKAMAYYRCTYVPNGNCSMAVAQSYFKRALELGAWTDEEKAEIYFMLARCELNEYTLENGEILSDDDWNSESEYTFTKYMKKMNASGFQSNFEILATKYKKTEFYDEVIQECRYFAYYVN